MIKKSDLDSLFRQLACKMNREPANHALLGKKVYYKKGHMGVSEKAWGTYIGIVIAAFRPRKTGARVRELVIKKGSKLDVARPDMVTTRKPKRGR